MPCRPVGQSPECCLRSVEGLKRSGVDPPLSSSRACLSRPSLPSQFVACPTGHSIVHWLSVPIPVPPPGLGGGGGWNPTAQRFMYQKQPKSLLSFVNFILSHYEFRVRGGGVLAPPPIPPPSQEMLSC